MLLEKLVTSTSLTSVISIKPHDSLFVKTEPDLTGFIEDENYVQSNDDFPEEDVDEVIGDLFNYFDNRNDMSRLLEETTFN